MSMFGFRVQNDNSPAPPLLNIDPGVAIPYLVLVVVATLVGIIGNILIIGAFFVSKRVRIVGNEFVLNLAVADLMITIFADPFLILGVTAGEAWFAARPGLCEFVACICLGSCICAFLTLTAVTISRYIYVCHSEYYSSLFTRCRIVALCILCWVAAFLLESANFLGWGDHKFDRKHNSCMWDRTKHLSYTLFLAVGLIGLPISIMITAYVLIFIRIRKMKMRVALATSCQIPKEMIGNESSHASANARDTTFSNAADSNTAASDNKTSYVTSWRRAFMSREWLEVVKSTRTLFLVLVAFVITWGPYAIVNAADVEDTFSLELHLYVSAWAHMHSAANCAIYAATNPHFRLAFKRVLCLNKSPSQVNPNSGLELASNQSVTARQACHEFGSGKRDRGDSSDQATLTGIISGHGTQIGQGCQEFESGKRDKGDSTDQATDEGIRSGHDMQIGQGCQEFSGGKKAVSDSADQAITGDIKQIDCDSSGDIDNGGEPGLIVMKDEVREGVKESTCGIHNGYHTTCQCNRFSADGMSEGSAGPGSDGLGYVKALPRDDGDGDGSGLF